MQHTHGDILVAGYDMEEAWKTDVKTLQSQPEYEGCIQSRHAITTHVRLHLSQYLSTDYHLRNQVSHDVQVTKMTLGNACAWTSDITSFAASRAPRMM